MSDQTQESRIRLVLLADRGLFRASLGHLLGSEPDLDVVRECDTCAEALDVLCNSAVDVVLLDFDIGGEQGNDFIAAARQAGYQGRFLIVAGSADVRKSAIALKLGASGIFLKSDAADHLVQAIRLVGNGGMWVDQKVIQSLAERLISNRSSALEDQTFLGPLEDRERNVLSGILAGLTNRKIGDSMGLTESNVKNIVQRLFGKAGVKTRGQLVRVALDGSLDLARESSKQQPDHMPTATLPKFDERHQPLARSLAETSHR